MIKVTTAPASEPITLSEVKLWLKIEEGETVEDTLLNSLITASRQWVESHCGISIMPQTITESYDCWYRLFCLQRNPVVSVTAIKYTIDEVLTVYSSDDYVVDLYSTPTRILITGDAPTVDDVPGTIKIEYVSGYADAATVPGPIKTALLYKIGSMYVNRADYAQRYLNFSLGLLKDYKSEFARI